MDVHDRGNLVNFEYGNFGKMAGGKAVMQS